MNYRIGLDIGIGSVGWAVVSDKEDGHPARLEDFGTRIFESGEKDQGKATLCQERRLARGVRRLERRRIHRKTLLKNHFQNIGFLNAAFNDDLAACKDTDVYTLKVKGLDEKLSPAELYKCLAHTCNHRGYREFYEPTEDDAEAGMNETAANVFEKAFRESGKRTVSEYLLTTAENGFVRFRNRSGGEGEHLLIRRHLLEDEARLLLEKQGAFYPCLNARNIDAALTIIFNQRDFEDGPGNPNDKTRKYQGFLESLGKCPFYKEEDRGSRCTVIADVYAVTNTLSQYRFVEESTGEYKLDKKVAATLVQYLLQNAKLTMTDVKRILKAEGYRLNKSEKSDDKALGKAIKFLSVAKKSVEEAGLSWEALITEEQFDAVCPSTLRKVAELVSKYQTPSRRETEMKKAGIEPALIKAFKSKRLSGTASVSDRYMLDSIEAFLNGDIYGNFQAIFLKNREQETPTERFVKLPDSCIEDEDVRKNRVVFKAINETRKIVNAIIATYGSPTDIVVEVASELGESAAARAETDKRIKRGETANDKVKENIAELLNIHVQEVKGSMIERYKLYAEQEGKCPYSGRDLGDLKKVLLNANREYEIDHIVPYSLILDNTLNNKVLVYAKENQNKGQRTPLQYMNEAQKESFLAFVNMLASRKENPISKTKLRYCNLETVLGAEAEEILSDWKSRNINDTRYITKYVCSLFERHLLFAGDPARQHVFPVKGAVTQKFRREWFRDCQWGEYEKNRTTYLNHALDAVVAANLTKPYIEIGSDALRLIAILKLNKGRISPEYTDYLERCVVKMRKYYGFSEDYTRTVLSKKNTVTAFMPRLTQEVKARFNDSDPEQFSREMKTIYGREAEFVVPPHIPVTSIKQNKKFCGTIADSNPVRIVEIDGQPHKIRRVDVRSLKASQLTKLRTDDPALRQQLEEILSGKDDTYTVDKYLKENDLSVFTTTNGQKVRKVSLDDGVFTNYYRKEIGDGNYTNLGMLKYYCVELYRNKKDELCVCGIRFVDLIKKDKKLWRKAGTLPPDYEKHEMYLFPGDYIRIKNGKGIVKFEGYYTAVFNINQGKFYCKIGNCKDTVVKTISKKDTVKKVSVHLLGRLEGEVDNKCSVPFACIGEKKSL